MTSDAIYNSPIVISLNAICKGIVPVFSKKPNNPICYKK